MSHPADDPNAAADEELVARVQASGGAAAERAASELLARHQRRVYVWVRGHVRDHERALDLTQEILVKAYRGLPGFQRGSRFTTWLFAIARNHCLDATRRPQLDIDPEFRLESLLDDRPGPLDDLARRQAETRLLDLVDRTLDPQERRAVWMRSVEGVAVDEITRRLGLDTASGARGLLQTARRKLRAALARERKGTEDG